MDRYFAGNLQRFGKIQQKVSQVTVISQSACWGGTLTLDEVAVPGAPNGFHQIHGQFPVYFQMKPRP